VPDCKEEKEVCKTLERETCTSGSRTECSITADGREACETTEKENVCTVRNRFRRVAYFIELVSADGSGEEV